MQQGTITLTLEGASLEQTEKVRQFIITLFDQGIFNIRNGQAVLHFDNDGILQEIEVHIKKWRRNKSYPLLQSDLKYAKISIVNNENAKI